MCWSIPLRGAAIAAKPNASSKSTRSPIPRSISRPAPAPRRKLIRHVGKRAIPQFVIDGKWIQPYRPGRGFLHQEMAELFGVGGTNRSILANPLRDRFNLAIRRPRVVQDAAGVHFVRRAYLQLQPP